MSLTTFPFFWGFTVDFALKVVQWSESETVRLQLWDIAGTFRQSSKLHPGWDEAPPGDGSELPVLGREGIWDAGQIGMQGCGFPPVFAVLGVRVWNLHKENRKEKFATRRLQQRNGFQFRS